MKHFGRAGGWQLCEARRAPGLERTAQAVTCPECIRILKTPFGMKVCSQCRQTKPEDEYFADKRQRDGKQAKCKGCSYATSRIWYENNYERLAALKRAEYHRDPAKKREMTDRYNRNNPEKYKAHWKISAARRYDKIQEAPCERCGKPGEAHHDDYSKPLEVRWLCRRHHAGRHAELRREGRDPDAK